MVGLALEVVGAGDTAMTVPSGSAWLVGLALLPYGLGLGLASAQLTSITLLDVPTGQSGAGSATQSTVRQLGAALGSALAGTTLATMLGTHRSGAALGNPADFAAASAAAIWLAVAALTVALVSAGRLDHLRRDQSSGAEIQIPMAPTDAGLSANSGRERR